MLLSDIKFLLIAESITLFLKLSIRVNIWWVTSLNSFASISYPLSPCASEFLQLSNIESIRLALVLKVEESIPINSNILSNTCELRFDSVDIYLPPTLSSNLGILFDCSSIFKLTEMSI